MGYSVQQLCDAILGMFHYADNKGENKQGQRLMGYTLSCEMQIRSIDLLAIITPPEPFTEAHQRFIS